MGLGKQVLQGGVR